MSFFARVCLPAAAPAVLVIVVVVSRICTSSAHVREMYDEGRGEWEGKFYQTES